MMSHNLVVLPLLMPLLTGILLIFFNRYKKLARLVVGISALGQIAVAAWLVQAVRADGIQTLHMSGWKAPFGITFVADMFAALLVLAVAVIGAACVFYSFATIEEAREKHYYYAFVQFLLVGVTGSFLTGDIFNLFVCFEVMLISSYALIVIGGEKKQLRETLKYILINIVSSTLFVTTIAYLYASVGTLNMAHLSERVAEAGQGGILTVIAVLLLIVFGLKAGLFLFFWLPGSYGVPPAAVIALFGGLLTKVGVYAIVRMFTLIFYHDQVTTHAIIGWMAGATMVLGALGAVAYRSVNKILSYNIVISIGFIVLGLAAANPAGFEGLIFYLLHDMLAKTLIFLLGGLIIAAAGTDQLQKMGGLIRSKPSLGWIFFVTIAAIVGVPPLSGFVGKLLIVEGGFTAQLYWLTGIGIASSLFMLYSLINVFMKAFWGKLQEPQEPQELQEPQEVRTAGRGGTIFTVLPTVGLVGLLVAFGLGAEWLYTYVEQAGEVLINPQLYIDAVGLEE